ncbi:MAG TPA: NADH-quinone oxidoreductase subunit H [Candidatus Eisenbacteria bacterium]
MNPWSAIALHVILLLVLPPLMLGVIDRTRAWVAGRRGPPLRQPYRDLARLLRKGAVYSRITTPIFVAGPLLSLAALLTAGLLIPLASNHAPLGFVGDVVAFGCLLGLGRFVMMAAALDTGSSFEGLGASREATFSALTEATLFLILVVLCVPAGSPSFEAAWNAVSWASPGLARAPLLAAAVALFVVILAENSRIPVDDPHTHLELTMIHEVMILDHSGPDLAFISYAAALKLFLFGSLLIHAVLPFPTRLSQGLGLLVLGQLALAVLIGTVESVMARLRLVQVPRFLIGGFAMAAVGLVAHFYRIGR